MFGKVVGRDDINHILLLDVMGVMSIPNITVKGIAIKDGLIWLKPNTSIREASKIFCENNINGAPVIDDNKKLVGMITLHDIAKALCNNIENDSIDKIMSKDVITITPNKKVYDALDIMEKNDIGRLVVVDEKNNTVIGIITRTDVLKLIEGILFPKILKELVKRNEL